MAHVLPMAAFELGDPVAMLVQVKSNDPLLWNVHRRYDACMPTASLAAAAILIASGIHLIPGATTLNAQPDGNSILIDAPQGVIVIDTGRHAAHTQHVIDFAPSENRPIAAIVNSHWHLDHVGGNGLIRSSFPGVHVYATAALRGAMSGFLANYRKQLEAALGKESEPEAAATLRTEIALIDSGPALMPTDVVESSARRVIAGRPLQLFVEKAATAGDLWIFDEPTKVLIAGDLVTLPAPFFPCAFFSP